MQGPDQPTPSAEEQERRSVGEYVKEAWSQALVAVNAAEDEVQKILSRVTGWVEMGPDEARRLGAELSEKLRQQRGELESTVETAVRRAVAPFRFPSREDVQQLVARIDRLEERIEKLSARK